MSDACTNNGIVLQTLWEISAFEEDLGTIRSSKEAVIFVINGL
jgi:hypothetical protein